MELAEIIERRRKAREYVTKSGVGLSPHVFHRNGRPIDRTTFAPQWRRACIKAGLGFVERYVGKDGKTKTEYRGKIFHDFRRTAARNMIRAGVPQSIAQDITGHSTSSMFTRYDICDTRDRLKALEAARAYVEERTSEPSNLIDIRSRG